MSSELPFDLDAQDPSQAKAIADLMIAAYRIEAARIGIAAEHFPPCWRSVNDIASVNARFFGTGSPSALQGVLELEIPLDGPLIIASLVTSPEYFRQHCASRLLETVIRSFPDRDLLVSTARANGPARQLYAKHGFKECRLWCTPGDIPIDMVSLLRAPS